MERPKQLLLVPVLVLPPAAGDTVADLDGPARSRPRIDPAIGGVPDSAVVCCGFILCSVFVAFGNHVGVALS